MDGILNSKSVTAHNSKEHKAPTAPWLTHVCFQVNFFQWELYLFKGNKPCKKLQNLRNRSVCIYLVNVFLCFQRIKHNIISLFTRKDKTEKGLSIHCAFTFIAPYICRTVYNPPVQQKWKASFWLCSIVFSNIRSGRFALLHPIQSHCAQSMRQSAEEWW